MHYAFAFQGSLIPIPKTVGEIHYCEGFCPSNEKWFWLEEKHFLPPHTHLSTCNPVSKDVFWSALILQWEAIIWTEKKQQNSACLLLKLWTAFPDRNGFQRKYNSYFTAKFYLEECVSCSLQCDQGLQGSVPVLWHGKFTCVKRKLL